MTIQTIDYIAQIWITCCGCAAIWLVGRLENWKRWGYIIGLMSQPGWFITIYISEQWGIIFFSLWCTYSWIQGVYNYWIKK